MQNSNKRKWKLSVYKQDRTIKIDIKNSLNECIKIPTKYMSTIFSDSNIEDENSKKD